LPTTGRDLPQAGRLLLAELRATGFDRPPALLGSGGDGHARSDRHRHANADCDGYGHRNVDGDRDSDIHADADFNHLRRHQSVLRGEYPMLRSTNRLLRWNLLSAGLGVPRDLPRNARHVLHREPEQQLRVRVACNWES
jgi:hypothetical protein